MTPFMNSVFYWKLAIWKFINGAFKIAILSFIASTAGVHWEDLHGPEKTIIILTVIGQVMTYIDGVIDQTISKLSKETGAMAPGVGEPSNKTLDNSITKE